MRKLSVIGLCLALMLLSGCGPRERSSNCPLPLYPLPEAVAQDFDSYDDGTVEDKWVVDFYQQQEKLKR